MSSIARATFEGFDPLQPVPAGPGECIAAATAAAASPPAAAVAADSPPAAASPPAATAAAAALPAPATRRRRHRNRARTAPGSEPAAAAAAAGPRVAAPWEEDTEAEAAEQREANRLALRKAIRSKRQQRSSQQALSRAEEMQQARDAAPGMAGAAATPDADLLGKIDARTLQAIMKKAGFATDNLPSSRRVRRLMQNLTPAQMAAMAGSAGGSAALAGK
jgi:2-oxoglutarate dehydrogenase complex dehydrogenase (E1) component-like enzyme